MSLPKRIQGLVKLSPWALVVLSGLLVAGPATAAPLAAGPPETAGQQGEAAATLVGPRRVVVRDLPPVAASAAAGGTEHAQEVAPLRLPAGWDTGASSPAPAANAVDAAFSAQAQTQTPPTSSPANFDGLDNEDNAAITGFIVRPPDPQLAAGPNDIFEMINISGRIYSRTGGTVQSFSLASFFGVPSGYGDTDPKIIYDAPSGRWFASYVSYINRGGSNDEGRLHLAISQTSDPTGVWNVYYRAYSNVLPDYAAIGVTNDKFTISSNVFDIDHPLGLYFGEETIVIEKADVLAGVAGADVGLFAFPLNTSRFTVRPAHSLTSVSDQYLVTRGSATTLALIRVTGTPDQGNVAQASTTTLPIISQNAPPLSVTAGGAAIDSGDQRLLDAMWRDGSLWTSASAACVPPGDSATRSCAHLIEVNTGSNTVTQDIMFGAAGEYFSWPAVRTDASGDLYVSLTHTNSSIFAEARAAGRMTSEPPNTMSGSTLLRAGEVVHTSDRWGDYLAAAVDPRFPECVWLVGQYAENMPYSSDWDWGTYIAATSYSGGCDGDNDGWTDFAEQFLTTNPSLACGANGWPPDPEPASSGGNGAVQIDDLFFVTSRFGALDGQGAYSPRAEIGSQNGVILIDDTFAASSRFGQSC